MIECSIVAGGVAAAQNFGGDCFGFRRMTLFCLGYRLSKHKMTIYAKNLGCYVPLGPRLATAMVVAGALFQCLFILSIVCVYHLIPCDVWSLSSFYPCVL